MINALQYIMELSEDALDVADVLVLAMSKPGKDLMRMLGQISTLAEVSIDDIENKICQTKINKKLTSCGAE